MTMDKSGERACLRYKLLGSVEALTTWGHEFVRFLCAEVGDEYHERKEKGAPIDELMELVKIVVPFHMKVSIFRLSPSTMRNRRLAIC